MLDSGILTVHLTGATGFVGWHLAEAFRDQGWPVTALVRRHNAKPLPVGIASVEAPLEADALARAVEGSSLIVHAAGQTHARNEAAFSAVNVAGTEALVTAANRVGARILLISSQAAIGSATRERPSREDDDPGPLTAYGRSKLAAEEVVKSRAQTPWTIVRPSAAYGPRDRQFLPLFRLASRGWFPIAANPAAAFTLIYVEDLARAVVLAAIALTRAGREGGAGRAGRVGGAGKAGGAGEAGGVGSGEQVGLVEPTFSAGERAGGADGKVLFLGHSQPQTADDLLRALAAAYQRPYRPRHVPAALLDGLSWIGELSWIVGRQPHIDRARLAELRAGGFVCGVDRARDLLGFTAVVGLTEGVERTARWYRNQGWV